MCCGGLILTKVVNFSGGHLSEIQIQFVINRPAVTVIIKIKQIDILTIVSVVTIGKRASNEVFKTATQRFKAEKS
jgi:hypothetical protein